MWDLILSVPDHCLSFCFVDFRFFYACFKRFTRGLDTYANSCSRMLTYSWPYLTGLVESVLLPWKPIVGWVKLCYFVSLKSNGNWCCVSFFLKNINQGSKLRWNKMCTRQQAQRWSYRNQKVESPWARPETEHQAPTSVFSRYLTMLSTDENDFSKAAANVLTLFFMYAPWQ